MDLQDLFLRKLDLQQKLNRKFFLSKLRSKVQGYVLFLVLMVLVLYSYKLIIIERISKFKIEEMYKNKDMMITLITIVTVSIIIRISNIYKESISKNILTNANIYHKYRDYKKLEDIDFQDKKKIIAMEWFLFENDISKYVINISLINLIYKYFSYNKKISFTKNSFFNDIFENEDLQNITEVEIEQAIETFENFSIDNKVFKSNDIGIIEVVLAIVSLIFLIAMFKILFVSNFVINGVIIGIIVMIVLIILGLWNFINDLKIGCLEVLDNSMKYVSSNFLGKKNEKKLINIGESYFIEHKRFVKAKGGGYMVYDIIFLEQGKISFYIRKRYRNIEDAQKLCYYLNKKLFT